MFATAGSCIKFWNIGDHSELSVASELNENVCELSYSCEGSHLASLSKNTSEIYLNAISESSAAKLILTKFIDNPTTVQFTNSSTRFLGACSSNNVLIWDIKGNNIKKKFKIPARTDLCKLSFSSSDSHTATGSRGGSLFLLSNSNNSISNPIKVFDEETELTDLQYSRHNLFLLGACCQRGSVVLVDTNVGKVIKNFRHAHSAPVTSLVFSPLNELLLTSVGYDKRIIFYNSNAKNCSVISSQSKQDPLTSAAFHPNGKHILLGTVTGKLELLDLRMLTEPVSVVKAYDEAIVDIKFQPVGKNKMKRRSETAKLKKNIDNIVPDLKENVAPEARSENCPDLFSPIRNVNSPHSALTSKNHFVTTANQPGSSQPKKNEDFIDIFSPLKADSFRELKDLINDQNYSFEGILLSPARNKDDLDVQTSTTNTEASDELRCLENMEFRAVPNAPIKMSDRLERLSIQDSLEADTSITSKERPHEINTGLGMKNVVRVLQMESEVSTAQIVSKSTDNLKSAVLPQSETESPIKDVATRFLTLDGMNNCCSGNLSIIQNFIQSEFENQEIKTNQKLMDLHYAVYKQFFSLRKDIMQMMEEHNAIYTELINENMQLKEELERLRANY